MRIVTTFLHCRQKLMFAAWKALVLQQGKDNVVAALDHRFTSKLTEVDDEWGMVHDLLWMKELLGRWRALIREHAHEKLEEATVVVLAKQASLRQRLVLGNVETVSSFQLHALATGALIAWRDLARKCSQEKSTESLKRISEVLEDEVSSLREKQVMVQNQIKNRFLMMLGFRSSSLQQLVVQSWRSWCDIRRQCKVATHRQCAILHLKDEAWRFRIQQMESRQRMTGRIVNQLLDSQRDALGVTVFVWWKNVAKSRCQDRLWLQVLESRMQQASCHQRITKYVMGNFLLSESNNLARDVFVRWRGIAHSLSHERACKFLREKTRSFVRCTVCYLKRRSEVNWLVKELFVAWRTFCHVCVQERASNLMTQLKKSWGQIVVFITSKWSSSRLTSFLHVSFVHWRLLACTSSKQRATDHLINAVQLRLAERLEKHELSFVVKEALALWHDLVHLKRNFRALGIKPYLA